MNPPQQLHIPVLLDSVLQTLNPAQGEKYLDLTAGYGGHAKQVIDRIGGAQYATLCDRDDFAIANLQALADQGARLIHSDFSSAAKLLVDENQRFDLILLDLGVSSPQLDRGERGFSLLRDGPLDMRMDSSQQLTAEYVINRYSERDLIEIFESYGEVPVRQARAIARAIVIRRKRQPFVSTLDLAETIRRKVGEMDKGRFHKVHPATRIFQAVRIAVNDELGQLEQVLPLAVQLLAQGGRLGVITFHSLEDRIVKDFMRDNSDGLDSLLNIVTKKPIAGDTEDVYNPRARSAKLRVAVKK